MRRTLKPFITEYKGNNRRPPAAISDLALSEPKRQVPAFEAGAWPEADDSYEAAMRAADALFAPAPRPADPKPAPVVVEAQPSHPAAVTPSASPVTESSAEPPKRGRILRVLDEAPAPELAALEAERAPKRRGRKPGSKNKPKAVAALTIDTLDHPPVQMAATHDAFADQLDEDDVAIEPSEPRVSAIRQVAALPASDAPPRGERKNAWMRDKLRPGEEWKRRRLPRVCW